MDFFQINSQLTIDHQHLSTSTIAYNQLPINTNGAQKNGFE